MCIAGTTQVPLADTRWVSSFVKAPTTLSSAAQSNLNTLSIRSLNSSGLPTGHSGGAVAFSPICTAAPKLPQRRLRRHMISKSDQHRRESMTAPACASRAVVHDATAGRSSIPREALLHQQSGPAEGPGPLNFHPPPEYKYALIDCRDDSDCHDNDSHCFLQPSWGWWSKFTSSSAAPSSVLGAVSLHGPKLPTYHFISCSRREGRQRATERSRYCVRGPKSRAKLAAWWTTPMHRPSKWPSCQRATRKTWDAVGSVFELRIRLHRRSSTSPPVAPILG